MKDKQSDMTFYLITQRDLEQLRKNISIQTVVALQNDKETSQLPILLAKMLEVDLNGRLVNHYFWEHQCLLEWLAYEFTSHSGLPTNCLAESCWHRPFIIVPKHGFCHHTHVFSTISKDNQANWITWVPEAAAAPAYEFVQDHYLNIPLTSHLVTGKNAGSIHENLHYIN